jgi:hypothetical protein
MHGYIYVIIHYLYVVARQLLMCAKSGLYCNQEEPFICHSRVHGNDKELNEKKSDLADCRHIAFCQKMLECLPGRRGTTG